MTCPRNALIPAPSLASKRFGLTRCIELTVLASIFGPLCDTSAAALFLIREMNRSLTGVALMHIKRKAIFSFLFSWGVYWLWTSQVMCCRRVCILAWFFFWKVKFSWNQRHNSNHCSVRLIQAKKGKRKLKGKGNSPRRQSVRTFGSRQPCYTERWAFFKAVLTVVQLSSLHPLCGLLLGGRLRVAGFARGLRGGLWFLLRLAHRARSRSSSSSSMWSGFERGKIYPPPRAA